MFVCPTKGFKQAWLSVVDHFSPQTNTQWVWLNIASHLSKLSVYASSDIMCFTLNCHWCYEHSGCCHCYLCTVIVWAIHKTVYIIHVQNCIHMHYSDIGVCQFSLFSISGGYSQLMTLAHAPPSQPAPLTSLQLDSEHILCWHVNNTCTSYTVVASHTSGHTIHLSPYNTLVFLCVSESLIIIILLLFSRSSPPYAHSLPITSNGHARVLQRPFSMETSVTLENQKVKRRFTLGKKAKKVKRRSHTTEVLKDLQRVDNKGKPQRSGTLPIQQVHTQQVHPSSGLNWSVPEDLPGVVCGSSPSSSQTPSLDSMFFTLGPARSNQYASDPDIVHVRDSMEESHFLVFRSHSTVGQAKVNSCDVAIQVGAKEEVQRFPTPTIYTCPVGPTIPGICCISPSPSNSSQNNSRHATPVRNLPPVLEGDNTESWRGFPLAHRSGERGRGLHESREPVMYEKYGVQNEALVESDEEDDTYGECQLFWELRPWDGIWTQWLWGLTTMLYCVLEDKL